MAGAEKRRGIVESCHLNSVYRPADGTSVSPLDAELVLYSRQHRTIPDVRRGGDDAAFKSVWRMFINAGQHVEVILPSPENEKITCRICVGRGCSLTTTVAPDLDLEIAVRRITFRGKCNAGVFG